MSINAAGQLNFTSGELLAVIPLKASSARAQAKAIYVMLKTLHIAAKVRALIFDTSTSNSEWKNEAAKSLEEMLGKKVLYLRQPSLCI